MLKRRQFLAGTAALLGALPIGLRGEEGDAPLLTFAIVTDCHYADMAPIGIVKGTHTLTRTRTRESPKLGRTERFPFRPLAAVMSRMEKAMQGQRRPDNAELGLRAPRLRAPKLRNLGSFLYDESSSWLTIFAQLFRVKFYYRFFHGGLRLMNLATF